jgi:hypothetical protein
MFLPDDAVREVAPSEYLDRWGSDRLRRRPPERTLEHSLRPGQLQEATRQDDRGGFAAGLVPIGPPYSAVVDSGADSGKELSS